MRGLLSSRTLKGPTSMKFSKFLLSHPKSLKATKRSFVRQRRPISEVDSSKDVGHLAGKASLINGEATRALEPASGLTMRNINDKDDGKEPGFHSPSELPPENCRKVVEDVVSFSYSSRKHVDYSLELPFHSPEEAELKDRDVSDGEAMEVIENESSPEDNAGIEKQHESKEQLGNEDHGLNRPHFSKGPIIPQDWEAAMSLVAETSSAICFICGGKNTGKSTFARYLLNSLIDRFGFVAFLDTDVGQPEFTPSGFISLHMLDEPIVGLPALEMRHPKRCYFFGDTSPKSNPEDYLESVFSLYDFFKSDCTLSEAESQAGMHDEARCPLVINTHGWIQGVGLDVLIKIVSYIAPTHIVQTLSKTSNKNMHPSRFWETKTTTLLSPHLLFIQNAFEKHTHLAEIRQDASELRDLRLLAYFERDLIHDLNHISSMPRRILFGKVSDSLASCKPYQVPISSINVLQQHFEVPSCEIVYSLNATLVGLAVSDQRGKHSKPYCIGLGIIRAIDVSKGLFYVLTPLKSKDLQGVDTFIQGRIGIPLPFLKYCRYRSPYLCENTLCMEGTGSAVMGKGKKKVLRMLRSQETQA